VSFRRPNEAAREKQLWQRFIREHQQELCDLGMPEQLFRQKAEFDHWLMHGYHPLDPSGFSMEQIDQRKRELLVKLLGAYFDTGFADPGVSILRNEEWRRILGRRGAR
jgi:hypothetical protein